MSEDKVKILVTKFFRVAVILAVLMILSRYM